MPSSLLFNRVKVGTATVGTGTITLGPALTTYLDFASGGVVNGNQVSYLIEDGSNWEIGTGIYTSSGTTLSRTVIKSSNSNAAINLSGTAAVSITALSTDIVTPDNAQTLTSKTLTSPTINTPVVSGGSINNTTIGATARSTGAFTTLSVTGTATFSNAATFNSEVALGGTATGGVTEFGVNNAATIASDVTSSYTSFRSSPSTEAAVFTLGTLRHFSSVGVTVGAGSGLNNQEAFYVNSNMTAAANNYGFVGSIPSGTGRWNFYADGTANNAFAGNTRFGGVTVPTVAVDVTGAVTATGAITGGSLAGPHNGTVGATTPASGAFTTLSASSTVSGTGFSTYLASPPAIGGTLAAAITGTTITANTGLVGPHNGTVGATTPTTGAFTTVTASTSVLSTGAGGVGYATGAGVAVTQATSRTTTTPTTGAKTSGAITLFTTTAVVGTYFSFTVPNTAIAVTDTVVLSVRGATNTYVASVTAITAATSFQITMASVAGTASDTPIVNFAIIKAVSA